MQEYGPGDMRVAPDGKYRVLGTDAFKFMVEKDNDWVVGDYDDKSQALWVARDRNWLAAGGRTLDPDDERLMMIHRYYVYDDEGTYVGGDIHNGE